VRARNKKRLENFAYIVNLPIMGNSMYKLFRAPAGLESDPDYQNSDWYKTERIEIEEQARLLETMKSTDIEHWGDELVIPGLVGDPGGYYTPSGKIRRRDAYNPEFSSIMKNECADREGVVRDIPRPTETYFVHIPDKYDFNSLAGKDKMLEGVFVLDVKSKRVVPINQCNWSWTNLKYTASNVFERLFANFARTGYVYALKE